jgi:predicted aconitase with swiveling domain
MQKTAWFTILVCSVCLEGLGRRYLPFIPQAAFYFLKDAVLLLGWVLFRPSAEIGREVRRLYGGFDKVLMVALFWTVAEVFNPEQQSFVLALTGLRSYWLWWIAPGVIAMALRDMRDKERAIYALLVLVVIVAAFAAIQFASPADSSVNMYSVWNGEEVYSSDTAIVHSTGRARVASTFAFVTGFVDFTILVPALLLSLGLDSNSAKVRQAALLGTLIAASVVPMSGSRSSVVIGAAILALALWSAGLFFTSAGRRILVGAIVASILAVVAFPEAFAGVESRFENNPEETNTRIEELTNILPPLAIARFDYPALGIGTGMEQNARTAFHISTHWDTEPEIGRYLVELGPFGFVLIWLSKLGLTVALIRAYKILKRAGRRGSAAAALAYGSLTMIGNLAFDHYWQALYFIGCGFILSEVTAVNRRRTIADAQSLALRTAAAGGPPDRGSARA